MVIERDIMTQEQKSKYSILLFLCFLTLSGQILDAISYAFFYLHLADIGRAQEINPVINYLYNIGNVPLVVAVKLFIGYRIWKAVPRFYLKYNRVNKLVIILLPLAAISGWYGFIMNTRSIFYSLG